MVNLILGSLERGTRRISKVRTLFNWGDLHMQFVIQDIPKNTMSESAKAVEEVSDRKRKRSSSPVTDEDYTDPVQRPHKRRCFTN